MSANDEQDIKALISRGLIDKNEFIELVDDAINVGVGFQRNNAITNKELVLEYFDEFELCADLSCSPQQILDQEVAKIDAEAEQKQSQSTHPKLANHI